MRAASLLAVLIACLGCRPPKPPGEPLGQFRVHAELDSSTCGDGVPAAPTLDFFVELRADAATSRGWWKLEDGASVEGRSTEEGFRFVQATTIEAVLPDPDLGYAGCALDQRETVEAALVEEDDEPLTGTSAVELSAVAGTDCTPLLQAYGGAFPTLPCALSYTLAGQRIE